MTSGPGERLISPDDEDWNWREGHKLLKELEARCRHLAEHHGNDIQQGYYYRATWVNQYIIWIGEETRVRVDNAVDQTTVYASHAQIEPRWKELQLVLLPLLRRRMILDDLSSV